MKWFVLAPANNSIMYDRDERLCGRWSMGSNQSTHEMKVVVLYGIIYDEGTSLFSFGHRTQMSSFLCFLFFVLFLSQNISFNAFLFVRPRNVYRNYYHNRPPTALSSGSVHIHSIEEHAFVECTLSTYRKWHTKLTHNSHTDAKMSVSKCPNSNRFETRVFPLKTFAKKSKRYDAYAHISVHASAPPMKWHRI